MTTKQFNHFVIVGAGIAGTTLALELWKKNCSVEVIDGYTPHSSSRVAAGILNPVVPKGVTLTWNAHLLFPSVFDYYSNWIAHWHKSDSDPQIFKFPFITFHKTEDEWKQWRKRYHHEVMQSWIQAAELPNFVKQFNDEQGLVTGATESKHCGRLDVKAFLDSAKSFLMQQGVKFHDRKIDYSAENPTDFLAKMGLSEKNVGIIFCEGIHAINNPLFADLFFHPTGGDILTLRIPNLPNHQMYKRGLWLVPVKNDIWLAGSNFHKGDLSETPLESDANDLIAQLKTWIPYPIELIEHKRGVRPTVQNRRPYLGRCNHSAYKNCFIFNGLGSKGSSLCSWLAPIMSDYLLGSAELPEEVDIQRFS